MCLGGDTPSKFEAEAESWGCVLEEGQRAPSHQLGGLGERCKLPQHSDHTRSIGSHKTLLAATNVAVSHFDSVFGALLILHSCQLYPPVPSCYAYAHR